MIPWYEIPLVAFSAFLVIALACWIVAAVTEAAK